MTNHSSILAWKNPVDRGVSPGGAQKCQTQLSPHTHQAAHLNLNFKPCSLERECQEVTDSDKECLLGVTPHGWHRHPAVGPAEPACTLPLGRFEPRSECTEMFISAASCKWTQRSQSIMGQGTTQGVQVGWSCYSRTGLKEDMYQRGRLAWTTAYGCWSLHSDPL